MTHDPLCDRSGTPADRCRICAVIARVREDERGKSDSRIAERYVDGYNKGRADWYPQALRDAVEAVKALPARGVNGTLAGWDTDKQEWVDLPWVRLNDAVAAIEALGGER